jgi:hypothetical protein
MMIYVVNEFVSCKKDGSYFFIYYVYTSQYAAYALPTFNVAYE